MKNETQALLRAEGLTIRRGGRTLLDDVAVELRPGQLTVLLGPNGAGKSTLFRLLAGEHVPDDGFVEFDGKRLKDWDSRALARRRAVVPQHSTLNFPFRVHEVVAMGRLPFVGTSEQQFDRQLIARAMGLAEISGFAERLYPTLSGGERQRVHLARALAQLETVSGDSSGEKMLLLDEPTSSLDWPHQQALLEILRSRAQAGWAILVILHDLNLAMAYADQVWLMRGGVLRATGAPEEVVSAKNVADVFEVQLHRWTEPGIERPLLALAPRGGGGRSW
jgi:iron complex transport system ATP-binding protein